MRKKQMSLGVILSYISIGVKLLSGILYTPIVLHSLGQSQYGVYSLCISFIGYLTILNAGVNAAYVRFYVQEKTVNEKNIEKINGLFGKIFVVLAAAGLMGGLIIAYFSPVIFGSKITPEEYVLAKKCFTLLAFTIAIEIITCLFKSFIIANEEFIFGKSLDILGAILAPVITVPLLLHNADCVAIVGVRLCVAAGLLVLNILYCCKKLKIGFSLAKADSGLLKNVSQFIAFIALQSVMDQLNWQIDKFILARTHGTTEISIYSVGGTFNTYFIMIGGAVSGVFIAEINRLVAARNESKLNRLIRHTSKLFTWLTGYLVLAFFIFGKAFILKWAGAEYSDSYTVGWMLMSPVSAALIFGLGQDVARAKNKHQVQIIINVCVCIVSTCASIPLAIYFGAVGSAFGTFVAEIIVCIIVQPIYYKKVVGIEVGNVLIDVVRYLPGIVLPLCFGVMIIQCGLLKTSYLSIMKYGIVFTIIYAVSIFFFSMSKDDRESVTRILKKGKVEQ